MSSEQEIIDELQEYLDIGDNDRIALYSEEVQMCIKALEKQIAKKPTVLINDKDVKIGCVTFRKGVKTYKCNCGCWVTLSQDYCSQCGQKLYWNEVD